MQSTHWCSGAVCFTASAHAWGLPTGLAPYFIEVSGPCGHLCSHLKFRPVTAQICLNSHVAESIEPNRMRASASDTRGALREYTFPLTPVRKPRPGTPQP